MKCITYNGYTNWDTWDLCLWLNNDESMQNKAKQMNIEELKAYAEILLKEGIILDEIDPHQVDWNEVMEAVKE